MSLIIKPNNTVLDPVEPAAGPGVPLPLVSPSEPGPKDAYSQTDNRLIGRNAYRSYDIITPATRDIIEIPIAGNALLVHFLIRTWERPTTTYTQGNVDIGLDDLDSWFRLDNATANQQYLQLIGSGTVVGATYTAGLGLGQFQNFITRTLFLSPITFGKVRIRNVDSPAQPTSLRLISFANPINLQYGQF